MIKVGLPHLLQFHLLPPLQSHQPVMEGSWSTFGLLFYLKGKKKSLRLRRHAQRASGVTEALLLARHVRPPGYHGDAFRLWTGVMGGRQWGSSVGGHWKVWLDTSRPSCRAWDGDSTRTVLSSAQRPIALLSSSSHFSEFTFGFRV